MRIVMRVFVSVKITMESDQELSDFTKRVHAAVRAIPPGSTATYAAVANAAGNPNAYRAVATVMAKNHNRCARAVEEGRCPAEQMVPCHRVVSARGAHVAYLGDTSKEALAYREALLAKEREQKLAEQAE